MIEVSWQFPAEEIERVDDILLERGDEHWMVLHEALSGHAKVLGVFASGEEAQSAWTELRGLIGWSEGGDEEAVIRTLPEEEWRDSYKAHFHAWQFGRLHWVPVWERDTFELPEGEAVLWLDPGMAFGTGNHETTRLCVERLVEHARLNGTAGAVIDVGCGSGILALSAAKLGFTHVVGFDNDPEAVRVSDENAALNGLSAHVKFFSADVVTGLAGREAKVVMANILAHVLIGFARELVASVSPGGILVLSGILATEEYRVREAFAAVAPNWTQDSRVLGEWCDVVLTHPANS